MKGDLFRMAALISLCAGEILAQESSRLSGYVWDSSAGLVPHATVTAVNQNTGFRRTAESDDGGAYEMSYLRPGLYKLTVRHQGFRTLVQFGLELQAAQPARVDFHLQIGNVQEVVTVTSGPLLLNPDDGSIGTVVGRSWIEHLPLNGRGLSTLLELAPGAVVTPASAGEAGQFSVNGQRPNTNLFTVDGVSANTGVSGGGLPASMPGGTLPEMTAFGSLHALASVEDLEEFRIGTSGAAGAAAPGGLVAMSTRPGSNDWHGAAFGALRNEALDANDWFANAAGQRRLALRFQDFGGVLGGRIRRDRTFFFVSYEGLRLRQPYTWQTAVPSLSLRAQAPQALRPILNLFPIPNGPDLGAGIAELTGSSTQPSGFDGFSARLDHALTPRHLLFARWSTSPSSAAFGSAFLNTTRIVSQSLTLGVNSQLTPRVTNEFRFNTTAGNGTSVWRDSARHPLPGCYTNPALLGTSTCISFQRFAVGGMGQIAAGSNANDHQRQFEVSDSIDIARGAHSLHVGADYRRLNLNRNGPATSVSMAAVNVEALLNSLFSVAVSQALQNTVTVQQFAAEFTDTWHASPRVTLTYGLRWTLAPSPLAPVPAGNPLPYAGHPQNAPIWTTSFADFAPRFGTAYRLTSDGRSILRAAVGRYYDASFGASTDGINGAPYNTWQYNGGPLPGTSGQSTTLTSYAFDRDLRIPSTWQWNVSLERGLTPKDAISAAYVGAEGGALLRREAGTGPNPIVEVIRATSHGWSRYHGFEAQYRRHLSSGAQAVISYSWSHSIDNSSSDSAVFWTPSTLYAQGDVGSSDFDVRHSISTALSMNLPARRTVVFRGWSLDGIFRARSGFPINVLDNETALGLSFANIFRPDRIAGTPVWLSDAGAPGGRRLNPAAFKPHVALQGNLGRNAIEGLGMWQADVGLRRTIAIRESSAMEFRVEAFNLLNHPAFADPARFLVSPLFGRSPSMLDLMLGSGSPGTGLAPAFQAGGPRSLQAVVRLRF